jgi:ferric-dicitrate binding protein FerR (iron transport regulator)
MSQKELSIIARKYLEGNATGEEKERLMEWYYAFDATELTVTMEAAEGETEEVLEQKMLTRLQIYIQQTKEKTSKEVVPEQDGKPGKLLRLYRRYGAAAAAVLLLCLMSGVYLWYTGHQQPSIVKISSFPYTNDVPPGKTGSVLTLPDGRRIVVDTAANGVLAAQGNAAISKGQDGLMVVTENKETSMVYYATLITPPGRTQMIRLADGTQVWLNAGSSARFPVSFTGKERMIEITGEVIVKVVHDANRPFKVKAKGQVFEDIGTEFDINAYEDEPVVKTTVLEGTVKAKSVFIKAGWQAQVTTAGQITLDHVDTDGVFAWRGGQFDFSSASIETIMRQAARWYDVTVVYEGKIDQQFTLSIGRNTPISKLLHYMEVSGGVHFEIQGRKIIVRP